MFRDEAQARVGIATDSLVSHGTIISGGRIHRTVVGVGCRINSFSSLHTPAGTGWRPEAQSATAFFRWRTASAIGPFQAGPHNACPTSAISVASAIGSVLPC